MEIRKHMIFSGEVQGVGFRYTAYMAAGKLGLSGWVANLEDGRVEMEVQGRERDIDLLTEKLRNGQWIEITGIEEEKRLSFPEDCGNDNLFLSLEQFSNRCQKNSSDTAMAAGYMETAPEISIFLTVSG